MEGIGERHWRAPPVLGFKYSSMTERDLSQFKNDGFHRGASAFRGTLASFPGRLFSDSLPIPSGVRSTILRRFGARVGQRVVLRSGLNISFPWRLDIGDHVWIGEGVQILSLAEVRIESHVCVSQGAFLCTGSHDYRDPYFGLITKTILLRKGCWVAARAFVGPGVEIGCQSVCAAGAVVTKSVPSHRVVAVIQR